MYMKSITLIIFSLLIILNIQSSNSVNFAQDSLVIDSISTHSQKFNYQQYGSFGGSTTIWIIGSGFSESIMENEVTIGGKSCTVQAASAFMLGCLAPIFEKEENYQVTVKVTGKSEQICKAPNNCQIKYSDWFTPKLYSVFPRSALPSQTVEFRGYFRLAFTDNEEEHQLRDQRMVQIVDLNGKSVELQHYYCDREEKEKFLPIEWSNINSYQQIPCRSSSDFVGGIYNAILNHKYNGFSQRMHTLTTMTADGKKDYDFRSVPKIDTISALPGSSNKGQILQITGAGFSKLQKDVKVFVAGQSCAILKTTKSFISCQVPAGDGDTVPANGFAVGGSGFQTEQYTIVNVKNADYYKDKLDGTIQDTIPSPVLVQNSQGLVFDLELGDNKLEQKVLQVYKGYFKAPVSGDYKFYVAGDDRVALYISNSPNDPDRASTKLKQIAFTDTYTKWRQYFLNSTNQVSSPQTLEKDKFYYMEVYTADWGGSNHYTVSVETPAEANDPVKIISMHDVQELKFNYQPQPETMTIKILQNNLAGLNGIWRFEIQGYGTKSSQNFTDFQPSADAMMNAFKSIQGWNTNVQVVRTITTDANGVETYEYQITFVDFRSPWAEQFKLGTVEQYKSKMVPFIYYYARETNNQNKFQKPTSLRSGVLLSEITKLPTKPISGTFKLQFNSKTTTDISFDVTASQLTLILIQQLDFDKNTEIEQYRNPYDGSTFVIHFYRMQGTQNDIVPIFSGTLQGDPSLPKAPEVVQKKIAAGSNNLFFEGIPTDFLYQKVTNPQVIVEINGNRAACPKNNCDYLIDNAQVPTITSYGLAGNVLSITFDIISGQTALKKEDIFINLAVGSSCSITSFQATGDTYNVDCTLPQNADNSVQLMAGSWEPELHIKGRGYAKIQTSSLRRNLALTKLDVALDVTQIVNTQTGSQCGGTELQIKGSGFPIQLLDCSFACSDNGNINTCTNCLLTNLQINEARKKFEVKIGDSLCLVDFVKSSNQELYCLTTAKTTNSDLVITINKGIVGQEKTKQSNLFQYVDVTGTQSSYVSNYKICTLGKSSTAAECGETSEATTSVHLSSSPVVKKDLLITGNSFGTNKNDIRCVLESTKCANCNEKPECCYELSVWSVTDTSIVCILSGGKQSTYKLRILKKNFGQYPKQKNDINDANEAVQCNGKFNTFEYKFSISKVTPNSGSINGGTLLTIDGENFNTDTVQNRNLVFLGDYNVPCDIVLSATKQNQIQCITRPRDPEYENKAQNVFVIQRTTEEAKCSASDQNDCKFTYSDAITPTIGDTAEVRETFFETEISFNALTGTTFDTSKANPILIFQGTTPSVQTTATEFSSNNVKFVQPYLDKVGQYQVFIQFPGIGYAKMAQIVIDFKLQPLANDQSGPAIVSKTLGTNNDKLSFTGTNLNTNAKIILSLQLSNSDTKFTREKSDNTETNALEFTLDLGGDKQIPAGDYIISVYYYQYGNVILSTTLQSLSIALGTITFAQTTPITSSYGGREITLNGLGFYSGSKNKDQNIVSVCGQRCKVTSNSYTQLKCVLPNIITDSSIQSYGYKAPTTYALPLSTISDKNNLAESNKVIDRLLKTNYISTAATCFIGLDYGKDFLLDVEAIDFYIQPQNSASTTAKKKFNYLTALIQGSNDESTTDFAQKTWVDLKKIDYVISGWNTWIRDETLFPNPLKFRWIRFYQPNNAGTYKSDCWIEEMRAFGQKIYKNIQNSGGIETAQCDVSVEVNQKVKYFNDTNDKKVQYSNDAQVTPLVTDIQPIYGSRNGGTQITISGQNFGSDQNLVSITIDGVNCPIDTFSATTIKCTTGDKQDLAENEFVLKVGDQRAVNVKGVIFTYVDKWSDQRTWGGERPPAFNESAQIPKGMNVLYDVSNTKETRLHSIIIDGGKLIFSDDADAELHAHYIICNQGHIQIGTEEKPHTHKLIITIYGKWEDKQLPFMGNKNLAVLRGKLDIHGVKRQPTWTMLEKTANKGDSQVELLMTVDWQPGEQVAIAGTELFDHMWVEDQDHRNGTEVKTILKNDVINGKSVLTFTSPLDFRHYSEVEVYQQNPSDPNDPTKEEFPMRCEIMLLNRNVVIQGDPEDSWDTGHGAHTMIMGKEEDGTYGKIENAEFRYSGQQTIIGRYSIHFHLNGPVRQSYVRGNVVHDALARILTLHGISFLRVQDNAGYKIHGHSFFIEDGVETQNIIERNLVIQTIQLWTLTKSDIICANYWITHPYNYVRNNHAAGSDFFGFWYELLPFPHGDNGNPDVFAQATPLGEFKGNVAHGSAAYGFRSNSHIPRTKIDQGQRVFKGTSDDPYSDNQSIEAVYEDFTTFQNGDNGIQFENFGHITFRNLKIADSRLAGFIIWSNYFSANQTCKIENALIVGFSKGNNGGWPRSQPDFERKVVGLITPNHDGLIVKNIRFYNFNYPQNAVQDAADTFAAIESCAKCHMYRRFSVGGWTSYFEGLKFNNVKEKIFWHKKTRNDIFKDVDGSLMEKQSDGNHPYYLTPYYAHLLDATDKDSSGKLYCERFNTKVFDDSVICNKGRQVRTVIFKNMEPGIFGNIQIKAYLVKDTLQKIHPVATFSDKNIDVPEINDGIDKGASDYSSSNSVCFVGIDLGSPGQYDVDEIRIVPLKTKNDFMHSAIQGSHNRNSGWVNITVINDKTDPLVTTVFTQDQSYIWKAVHQTNQSVHYRYYRFYHEIKGGSQTSSCNIGELEVKGRAFGFQIQSPKNGIDLYPLSWTLTFVTGKTYNVHWLDGLDFTETVVHPAFYGWEPTSQPVILRFNYSDNREYFQVCRNFDVHSSCSQTTLYDKNNTKQCDGNSYCTNNPIDINTVQFGNNYLDQEKKHWHLGIAGNKNGSVWVRAVKCENTCPKYNDECVEEQRVNGIVVKESTYYNQKNLKWSQNDPSPQGEPNSWKKPTTSGVSVTIKCGWTMVLDESTVELDELIVYGRLVLDDNQHNPDANGEVVLKAKRIWIHGELVGGSESAPLLKKYRIQLIGGINDQVLLIDRNLETHNKVLAVTGKMKVFGSVPKIPMTRLKAWGAKGSDEIQVDLSASRQISLGTVDWQVGDQLELGSTDFNPFFYEDVQIKEWVNESEGKIKLTKPLAYDHYGDADITREYIVDEPTKTKQTLDMRCLVGHLTRNIVIEGDDTDQWGCHVFVGGFNETQANTNLVKERHGQVELVGIQIRKCGQRNTLRASLDFQQLPGKFVNGTEVKSSFKGMSIHSNRGWAVNIHTAQNIESRYNVFADAEQYTFSCVFFTNKLIIDNNLFIGTRERKIDTTGSNQPRFLVNVGLDFNNVEYNQILTVTNNKINAVAGVGSVQKGTQCEENVDLVKNTQGEWEEAEIDETNKDLNAPTNPNYVVRHNEYSSCLTGVITVPADPNKVCDKITDFIFYKNQHGLLQNYGVRRQIMKRGIFADNQMGLHSTVKADFELPPFNKIVFRQILITILARPSCSQCYTANDCSSLTGVQMSSHNTFESPWPEAVVVGSIHKDQSFNQLVVYDHVTFENFRTSYPQQIDSVDAPWKDNSNIINNCKNNVMMSDFVYTEHTAPQYLVKSPCVNCEESALVKFFSPDIGLLSWIKGCGNMVCTGHYNVLVTDVDRNFQMVSPNDQSFGPKTAARQGCVWMPSWNGYKCKNRQIDTSEFLKLEFESTAFDRKSRLVSPVSTVIYDDLGKVSFNNTLNAHKEWHFNGGLPEDTRVADFNAIVPKNKTIRIFFAAKFPASMRFHFASFPFKKNSQYKLFPTELSSEYAIIMIQIDNPVTLKVYVGKQFSVSDSNAQFIRALPLKKDPQGNIYTDKNLWEQHQTCGANIYYSDNRTIAFVVNRKVDCMVHVVETKQVFVTMRFEISVFDFYKDNGEASFIDKISGFLGVSSDRIRIVNVRSGSVIIDFVVDSEKSTILTTQQQEAQLTSMVQKLDSGVKENKIGFPSTYKATVQSASISSSVIINNNNNPTTIYKINATVDQDTMTTRVNIIKQSNSQNNTALLVQVIVPIVVLIILGILISVYIKRKKSQIRSKQIQIDQISSEKQNYNHITSNISSVQSPGEEGQVKLKDLQKQIDNTDQQQKKEKI